MAIEDLCWRVAPHAVIDVDLAEDVLLVSCYPLCADVEITVSSALSVGFCRTADGVLLTTLCLIGGPERVLWASAHDPPALELARMLLGRQVIGVVAALVLRSDGELPRRVRLTPRTLRELLPRWRGAATRHGEPAPEW